MSRPNPRPEAARELLELAAQLPTPRVDKLAHALGWPGCYGLERGDRPRRVKWAAPYRNYYAGSAEDQDWKAAEALGLARLADLPREGFPYATWTVTELGQLVVRLRLEATRRAYLAAKAASKGAP